jgi:hypothetical protein
MAESDEYEMFDADGTPMCPYCRSIHSCTHLLLSVDVTFRETQGGALSEVFDSKWRGLCVDQEENPDFPESDVYDELLLQVENICDYDLIWDGFDTVPGMSSSYQIYWCKDETSIKDAIDNFSRKSYK